MRDRNTVISLNGKLQLCDVSDEIMEIFITAMLDEIMKLFDENG